MQATTITKEIASKDHGHRHMKRKIQILIFGILLAQNFFAQTNFKSEEDLKKNAEKLFTKKDYVAATPLFSQLLSTYPKDANYNFKYGVCILYTNKDRNKCLKYLQLAAKNPKTTNDVFYFLGKAYHLNQRFDEAIDAYTNYKKRASAGELRTRNIDGEITRCKKSPQRKYQSGHYFEK